jgi:hypothetical protein
MSVCVDPKRPHPGLILSHLWVTQRPSALMEAAEPQRPPKPALAQLTSAVGASETDVAIPQQAQVS